MNYNNGKVENIKIAYIGGGSRGWAWSLMSDLAKAEDICGSVYLYDIDFEAAKNNEKIGNSVKDCAGCKSVWEYKATKTIKEALEIKNSDVIESLGGLPPQKVHCSIMAEEAIHAALWDYAQKNGIEIEGLEKPKSDIHEDEEDEEEY